MTILSDTLYTAKKDAIVYNAFSEECCSDSFISLFRIMFMVYEFDSIYDADTKSKMEERFNEAIKEIFNNTCDEKSYEVHTAVDFVLFRRFITDFYLKNYNTITRTDKDVCYCSITNVLNAITFFYYSMSIPDTTYNDIIVNLPVETINLIQKYLQ